MIRLFYGLRFPQPEVSGKGAWGSPFLSSQKALAPQHTLLGALLKEGAGEAASKRSYIFALAQRVTLDLIDLTKGGHSRDFVVVAIIELSEIKIKSVS